MARRRLTRREVTLLAALAVAALAMLYLGQTGDDGRRVTATGAAKDDEGGPGEAPVVELALLSAAAEQYDPAGRDLFKYEARPQHPREAALALQRQEEQRRIERERKPPPPPPPPRQTAPVARGPVQPKPDFTYLGYFGPKDNKIAVFEKNRAGEDGDNLLLARAGEVLEEKFRLEEIKFETVVLGFTEEPFTGQTQEMSMRAGASSGSQGRGRRGRR